jgi:ribonuclease HI
MNRRGGRPIAWAREAILLRLYTDGSYSESTGVGSWAWVLVGDGHRLGSGVVAGTEHQRMELTAVIEGLAELPEGTEVEVVTDSAPLVEAMREGYVARWRERGWSSIGHDRRIAHADLWEQLLALADRRRVRFTWVKAHCGDAGDPWNVMADHLARTARRVGEARAA